MSVTKTELEQGVAAAFVRVEGVLVERGALALTAFFAANVQRLRYRLLRMGQMAVTAPAHKIIGQSDRGLATRMAYLTCRGMSEDRVVVLAEEFADTLADRILERGVELVRRLSREGKRVVLLSEGLAEVLEALGDRLGPADAIVANRLEFKGSSATGRLRDPVIGGHECGLWIKKYAAEQGIDLAKSAAYAAKGADLLLLSAAGEACAVNPDTTLRRAAREADWPILEYRA